MVPLASDPRILCDWRRLTEISPHRPWGRICIALNYGSGDGQAAGAITTIARALLVDANRPAGQTPIRFPTLAQYATLDSYVQSLPQLIGEIIATVMRTLPSAPEWWVTAGFTASGYQILADPTFWHMQIKCICNSNCNLSTV